MPYLFSRKIHYLKLLYRNMNLMTEKYKCIKSFEKYDKCLPNSWIVVRLDGKAFSRFTELHGFHKPNDKRALELMNRAAASVMEELNDVCLAFGQSDEYSFVFKKNTEVFNRNRETIMTVVSSLFASAYVYYWSDFFGFIKLLYPPGFDSRVIVYPSDTNLRDYLSWRQADTHINNLYNTVFWALVLKGNYERTKAQKFLSGTVSSEKNEILFKNYGINYNNEPLLYRKGTTLIRKLISNTNHEKLQQYILSLHCDLIGEMFWQENSEILELKSLQIHNVSPNTTKYVVEVLDPKYQKISIPV